MFGILTASLLLACAQDDPGTSAQEAPAPAVEQEVLRVERWLTLDRVDEGGRIPVSPDQVFLRHLIDPASPHPVEGEEVIGTSATHSWKSATPGADGNVPVPRGGWAYSTIDVPEDGVWLARLAGAIRIHVNGEAFVGDLYRYGFGGVPVFLKKGQNHLYIAGARGSFSLDFVAVDRGLVLANWDGLESDVVVGQRTASPHAYLVINATTNAVDNAYAISRVPSHEGRFSQSQFLGGFLPLAMRRVYVHSTGYGLDEVGDSHTVHWWLVEDIRPTLRASADYDPMSAPGGLLSAEFDVTAISASGPRRVAFRSEIDGSLQSFGYLPMESGSNTEDRGLVLSLHGASVDCVNQVRAYEPKPNLAIAAPTNRRPYGFDWQDWGREDAYEVVRHAQNLTGGWRDRLHLTGHSMGGHGTWHLAVNDPDRWASIAPSAGWSSSDSYGGRPLGVLDEVWRAADWTSETMALLPNLRGVPVSVLHGDADDNVPASEASAMVKAMTELGIRHQVHFEPGAGHWWGNRCVDWPGFFSMFNAVQRRPDSEVRSFDWRSASPAVDSRHYWFEAIQRIDSAKPFRVRAQVREIDDYQRIEIATENLRAFKLYSNELTADIQEVSIDGHLEWMNLEGRRFGAIATYRRYDWAVSPRQQSASQLGGALGALGGNQERDYWVQLEEPRVPPEQKSAFRDGPFKRAFRNNFVIIYGTAGDDKRDAVLMARARFIAQEWWYRGNGDCVIASDEQFIAGEVSRRGMRGDRNFILVGNSESNSAWSTLISDDCPLSIADGAARLGEQMWEGDDRLALAVYPIQGSDSGLVGIIAETGLTGARLGDALKYFVSGTGYPDYLIISSKVLAEGDGAVDAAGFFDYAWQLPK